MSEIALFSPSAWCISRQLWWGHRVPAYRIVQPERDSDRNVWVVAKNEEDALSKAAQQLQVNPSDIRLEQGNLPTILIFAQFIAGSCPLPFY